MMALTQDDKHWIVEQLRNVETTLLREFHKSAKGAAARHHSMKDEAALLSEPKIPAKELASRPSGGALDTATVLRVFLKGSSPLDTRQRSHSMAIAALDGEIALIKERLDKIEGRTPPQ